MCSIVGVDMKIIYTLVRALQLHKDLSIASQWVLLFFIALIHSLWVTKNTWQKLLSKFLGLNYLWVAWSWVLATYCSLLFVPVVNNILEF